MCPLRFNTRKAFSSSFVKLSGLVLLAVQLNFSANGQITGVAAEGASTLGKSRFMIGGYYSTIIPPGLLWEDQVINQPGIKLGLGISDRVDIKFYYSRWAVRESNYHQNIFQLLTKITGPKQMVALYLPFGLVHSKYKEAYREDDIGKIWMITPRVIGTLVRRNHFDLCIIPYLELLKEKSYKPVVTVGINLGMGFITLAKRLIFRFEGGLDIRTLVEGYPCGTAGLGLSYLFGSRD
jgi:hypothetical protein